LNDWLIQTALPMKLVDAKQAIFFQLFLLPLDIRECGALNS
jgi:hypothetical protein